MKRFVLNLLLLLVGLVAVPAYAQNDSLPMLSVNDLRTCDLLFAVNERGNAITQSTSKLGELPIDHVGILYIKGGKPLVVEATTGYGVRSVGVAQFLADNPVCVVGRVDGINSLKSVTNALRFDGLPYDSLFEPDDSAMYCSELVQKSFVDTLGHAVFGTIPMSFHDATGKILPYWTELYRRHGRKVPDGAPGTNPSQLSNDHRTKLVGWLYK